MATVYLRRMLHRQRRMFHKQCYAPYANVLAESPQAAIDREEIPVINPATGQTVSTILSASSSDVQRAIAEAQLTFESGKWSRSPAIYRSNVLARLARALESRIPQFARLETLQTGRPIREMNAQLGRLPEWLDYYAALLRTHQAYVAPTQGSLLNYVTRLPLGVVAQITPFNHPLLIAIKKIAPALAAGNSIIIKPSELAPISILEFASLATEVGVPSGVLSVLPGYGASTGVEIAKHPCIRKIDVTASTRVGRALGRIAGSNLATLTAELGGKAPILIFDDADLHCAVNGAAFACFIASGQTCVSGTRLIVQNRIYDAFIAHFLAKVGSIRERIGDPLNPQSMMGPVISSRHLAHIETMIRQRTTGTILSGGERMLGRSPLDGHDLSRGFFFAPTVIANISLDDDMWKEEIFGPVVVVSRYDSEDEGISLANECKYGLGAGIWTSDLSRAHRVAENIDAGLVWVNTHHRNDPSSPWGGMKESGIGRENGIEAFLSYLQTKSTILNTSSWQESRDRDDWFADDAANRRYG